MEAHDLQSRDKLRGCLGDICSCLGFSELQSRWHLKQAVPYPPGPNPDFPLFISIGKLLRSVQFLELRRFKYLWHKIVPSWSQYQRAVTVKAVLHRSF